MSFAKENLPILPAGINTCYIPSKWLCPIQIRESDGFVTTGSGEALHEPHHSYGTNVHGIDENDAFSLGAGTTYNPPPPQVVKGFHGYHVRQVKRPAKKLMFCDAIFAIVNVHAAQASFLGSMTC